MVGDTSPAVDAVVSYYYGGPWGQPVSVIIYSLGWYENHELESWNYCELYRGNELCIKLQMMSR